MISKKLRKAISKVFPDGDFKERVKLWYYNRMSNAKFSRVGENYHTVFEYTDFVTTTPLYRVIEDFKYYTYYHNIRPDDVIVDAGANQGFVSMYLASKLISTAKLYAFEPDDENIKAIKKNLSLNWSASQKVKILDYLLWNKTKEIEFYEAGTVGSSAHYIPDPDKVTIKQAITFDAWIEMNGIKKLDFIKMDIEGAEIEAIEGGQDMIKNLKPNLAIASYHIINGEPTYIKLEKMFKELNYPHKTVHFTKKEIITFAGPSVAVGKVSKKVFPRYKK